MLLFYIIYNVVLITAAIILLPFIVLALILVPKFRAGFWTKLGFYKNIKLDN